VCVCVCETRQQQIMFLALAQVYPVFSLQLQYQQIFCLRKNVGKTKAKRSVLVLNNTNIRL